jgi:lipoprotein NlpD
MKRLTRPGLGLLILLVAGSLVGCGAPGPLMPESQRPQARSAPPSAPASAPTVYRVVRGDTLYSIAFRYGLDWREVARWNGIAAPYTIRVGQPIALRRPPANRPAARPAPAESQPSVPAGPTAPPSSTPAVRPTPTPAPRPTPRSAPPDSSPATAPPATSSAAGSTAPIPTAATRNVAGVNWRWPTAGTVARGFNAGDTRKGILVAGTPGQPVRASASGTVVYSGNGLIGYGELIIIKHNDRMLSAYAHNRERNVVEGDTVQAGQQIATLGRNERDEPVLHFEIRRDGQPVDPIGYLPQR